MIVIEPTRYYQMRNSNQTKEKLTNELVRYASAFHRLLFR